MFNGQSEVFPVSAQSIKAYALFDDYSRVSLQAGPENAVAEVPRFSVTAAVRGAAALRRCLVEGRAARRRQHEDEVLRTRGGVKPATLAASSAAAGAAAAGSRTCAGSCSHSREHSHGLGHNFGALQPVGSRTLPL